jgi:hypothetical protein
MTTRLFSDRHPDQHPVSRNCVRKLIEKWRTFNQIDDVKHLYRNRPITEGAVATDVMQCIEQNPETSIRRLSLKCKTSCWSVRQIMKHHKYHPYKEIYVQELKETDFNSRTQFCTWFLERMDIWNVLFTDEAIFHLKGTSTHKRIWAKQNPLQINASKTLHSPKVMVWAGLMGTQIFGPYFFSENVTGKF